MTSEIIAWRLAEMFLESKPGQIGSLAIGVGLDHLKERFKLPEFKGASVSRGEGGKIVVDAHDKDTTISLEKGKHGGYDLTVNGETKHIHKDAGAGGFELNGGDGNDTISVGKNIGVPVSVDGGDGNDTIFNQADGNRFARRVKIDGGSGRDTIYNSGNDVYIDGGRDGDFIQNSGARAKIWGERTPMWTKGPSGSDVIINNSDFSEIRASPKGKIVSTGDDNKIVGTDGNDDITSVGRDNQVDAGRGSDTVRILPPRIIRP